MPDRKIKASKNELFKVLTVICIAETEVRTKMILISIIVWNDEDRDAQQKNFETAEGENWKKKIEVTWIKNWPLRGCSKLMSPARVPVDHISHPGMAG